ncbi:protein of unknown function [Nitrospira defluvii]|uniref:Uncharacterized protein n=1 Tax=Nitrospira defluvii TaxID=330214 RepID=D8PDP1_9BACT|nr:protein of unknown function [Nitrospira defluvii]
MQARWAHMTYQVSERRISYY